MASSIADHKYHLEGDEGEVLRRSICTPGTRMPILGSIVKWANDSSPKNPSLYWLFGPAGSGKSTIAYTIARRFELAPNPGDTIILGGNFFCSRQFRETRESKWIVRTLVSHLALICRPFADALSHCGKFNSINQTVRAQLEGLLIGPWKTSESARKTQSSIPTDYLIVIDALDEIDGTGGSEFLGVLLNVIKQHRLPGLKFFVTSRPDPVLARSLDSIKDKHLYRLEEVPSEEANADIRTYLHANLPRLDAGAIEELVTRAAGLFIYAATIMKYVEVYQPSEQAELLEDFLSLPGSAIPQSSPEETPLLDGLYLIILAKAFHGLKQNMKDRRLQILHTMLCTADRTTKVVVANLLCHSSVNSYIESANAILDGLHAVLYTENGNILWYHKSFPDFLFDSNRSKTFWCDQAQHHRVLTNSCFRIMKEELRFNIANIPTSFILDCDNHALADEVKRSITPTLSYACRNWDLHLSATTSIPSDSIHQKLSEFLQIRAIFWIEAMNLLNSRGRCYGMFQTAHKWVIESQVRAVCKNNAKLIGVVRETRHYRRTCLKPVLSRSILVGVALHHQLHTFIFPHWQHGQGS